MDNDIKRLASQRDKNVTEASDGWQSELRRTGNHGLKKNIFNIMVYLENDENLKGLLTFDEFSDQIFKLRDSPAAGLRKGTWADADDSLLRAYLDKEYDVVFSKDNVTDALVAVAQEKTINPMKERIESVEWDGQKRAEDFFIDYLGAENSHYTREVTRKWLAGAVARIYHPGVKFEIIPILEGPQGIGKSTTVRLLAPDYFNDSMKGMGKHKDDYQQLLGSWIIEIAELSAMRKTDIEGIKNFTSSQSDNYRNSYGKYSSWHPRKNVFIGTTNQTDYLKDATGERRFYPIKCGVNKATKNPWEADSNDILQILAEVKTWVDSHEKLYFDHEMMLEAESHQREAQAINPMKDAITDYLAMQVPTNWDNLTNSVKRSYLSKAMDNEDVQDADWLNVKLSTERVPLQQTTTREILAVVFNKRSDSYLSGSINSDAKKIKLIMDNEEGWNYNANVVISGKRQRGYKRA